LTRPAADAPLASASKTTNPKNPKNPKNVMANFAAPNA
jgi:hypothetical protein